MNRKQMILSCSLFIAFLNTFDGIATNYGLMNNFIEELNPLMDSFWQFSPLLFLNIKILLSTLIILTSYWVYQKSTATFQKRFLYLLMSVSVLYIGICCTHITWMFYI